MEFALQKTDLVQHVMSAYELPEAAVDICLKIKRHLLDPRIIFLSEEKWARIRKARSANGCKYPRSCQVRRILHLSQQ